MVEYTANEHMTTLENVEEVEGMEGTNPNHPPNE